MLDLRSTIQMPGDGESDAVKMHWFRNNKTRNVSCLGLSDELDESGDDRDALKDEQFSLSKGASKNE